MKRNSLKPKGGRHETNTPPPRDPLSYKGSVQTNRRGCSKHATLPLRHVTALHPDYAT